MEKKSVSKEKNSFDSEYVLFDKVLGIQASEQEVSNFEKS